MIQIECEIVFETRPKRRGYVFPIILGLLFLVFMFHLITFPRERVGEQQEQPVWSPKPHIEYELVGREYELTARGEEVAE